MYKNYGVNIRERMILELLEKERITFKDQHTVANREIFYQIMGTLQEAKPWRLVSSQVIGRDGREKQYTITWWGEAYAHIVKSLRELEGKDGERKDTV
jgi:hypothetical protein